MSDDQNAVGFGGAAATERTGNVAQDLQGLRFNVSEETPALHVVDPPPERPTPTLSRSSWERKVVRRIFLTDVLVVAFAVVVAHIVRFNVIPIPPAILQEILPQCPALSISRSSSAG